MLQQHHLEQVHSAQPTAKIHTMGKDEGKAEQQLGTKGFIHKISDLCFGLKKKRTCLREKNMLFCCLPSPKPSWFRSNAPAQIGHDTAQGDDHHIRGVIAQGTRFGCCPLALATWQGGAHKAPSCYQKLPTTSAAVSCAGHSTHQRPAGAPSPPHHHAVLPANKSHLLSSPVGSYSPQSAS